MVHPITKLLYGRLIMYITDQQCTNVQELSDKCFPHYCASLTAGISFSLTSIAFRGGKFENRLPQWRLPARPDNVNIYFGRKMTNVFVFDVYQFTNVTKSHQYQPRNVFHQKSKISKVPTYTNQRVINIRLRK